MPPVIPTQQQQIESIQEAERVQTPSASSISQADIDAELQSGNMLQGGKSHIYALYQQNAAAKDIISALKKAYGASGHGHTFLDGGSGIVDCRPATGITLRRYEPKAEVTVKWPDVERRIRQLIADGEYLTLEEREKYESDHLESPPEAEVPPPAQEQPSPSQPAPAAPVDPIAAIDAALQEWNGDIASKRAVVRYMEAHARDKGTAAWLRREYGDDLPAFPVPAAQMDLPWSKVQRRIAQLIQKDQFYTQEELDNFDDIDTDAVREHLESGEANPFVDQVIADVERLSAQEAQVETPPRDPLAPAYREGDTVYLDDTAFIIKYVTTFDVQLLDPTQAYPILRSESKENFERLLWKDPRNSSITERLPADRQEAEHPPAQPAPAAPVDPIAAVDAALREWNGDSASKRAVVRYMEAHARDKDTAVWLRQEYGGNLPAFPVPAAQMDVPWPKVQRRIAQLIQKNQFYTQEDRDRVGAPETPVSTDLPDQPEAAAPDAAAPARDPLSLAYQVGDTAY